jgi:hypothetical protein
VSQEDLGEKSHTVTYGTSQHPGLHGKWLLSDILS